jgi:hypothetical protein
MNATQSRRCDTYSFPRSTEEGWDGGVLVADMPFSPSLALPRYGRGGNQNNHFDASQQ